MGEGRDKGFISGRAKINLAKFLVSWRPSFLNVFSETPSATRELALTLGGYRGDSNNISDIHTRRSWSETVEDLSGDHSSHYAV